MRRKLLTQSQAVNKELFNLDIIPISMFDRNPPEVDILVIDEAHHDSTSSMSNIHEKCRPKRVLGLTATPERGDSAELLFNKVVRKAGVYELVRLGYLALADHHTIPEWTPANVANIYGKNKAMFGKPIAYFHTMVECEACLKLLTKHGVRAEIVDQHSDKEKQVDALEDGSLDMLINMNILTEGLNVPSLETVFSRDSNTLTSTQIIGRVLRTFPSVQKKIVQSVDTPNHAAKIVPLGKSFSWSENGVMEQLDFDDSVIQVIIAGTLKMWTKSEMTPEMCEHLQTIKSSKRGGSAVDE